MPILPTINKKLSEKDYKPFVTRVSIDERLSQKYITLKEKYTNLDTCKNRYESIAVIKEKKPFEDEYASEANITNSGYLEEFGDNIIKFSPSENTLSKIIERVFVKLPPFVKGNSDKGFKDALLWYSLLAYFESNKFKEVIFLTDDKGFVSPENSAILELEFFDKTQTKLVIKNSEHYRTLIEEEVQADIVSTKNKKNEISDAEIQEYRLEIEKYVSKIMYEEYALYEDSVNEGKFVSTVYFDEEYIRDVFEMIPNVLGKLCFQDVLKVSCILGKDGRIETDINVSIVDVEHLNRIHCNIEKKHPEYLEAFYNSVADKLNVNYKPSDFDELPF